MKTRTSRNSTIIVRVMCAIVFFAFTFCYLFFYQADILAYLQHTLSGGRTTYNPMVGAIIITFLLFLVQLFTYRLTRLYKHAHALTYFPSALILAILTDIGYDGGMKGYWLWLAPVLLILHGLLAWVLRQYEAYEPGRDVPGFFSRTMWVNMFTLALTFLFMTLMSNHDNLLHHRLRMERLLVKGHYDKALLVGLKTQENDSSLTMLRAYALARRGELGERLFTYPVEGGKDMLLPNGTTTRTLMMNPKIIKAFSTKKGRADYELTGYLLSRDLDRFARRIKDFYDTDSTAIPRHYREALVLYTHLRANRTLTFHDAVLDADYEDFRKLQKQHADKTLRSSALRDVYRNTYWCYFENK